MTEEINKSGINKMNQIIFKKINEQFEMEDEDARGSLTVAMDYVFRDDLEYLRAPYPTFTLK